MRISRTCPKCSCAKLWVIEEVRQPAPDGEYFAVPMPVTAAEVVTEGKWGNDSRRIRVGTFEAWICSKCGFTEWYARDVNERLAELATIPGSAVRLVEPGAPRGPFR